jgi:hypothetical protein
MKLKARQIISGWPRGKSTSGPASKELPYHMKQQQMVDDYFHQCFVNAFVEKWGTQALDSRNLSRLSHLRTASLSGDVFAQLACWAHHPLQRPA